MLKRTEGDAARHSCTVMTVTGVREGGRLAMHTPKRIVGRMNTSIRFPVALLAIGVLLLIAGSYYGLALSPPERFMGDVQRIMYVHVPTAWCAMLVLTFAFVCATAHLITGGLNASSSPFSVPILMTHPCRPEPRCSGAPRDRARRRRPRSAAAPLLHGTNRLLCSFPLRSE